MLENLSFFVVLVVSVIFSGLVSRLHVPWVVALIIGGIIIGPYGFDLIVIDETLDFLGDLGLVFLMFMAGLSVRLSSMTGYKGKILALSALNGLLPFIIAFFTAVLLGYSVTAATMLGIVFISSAIAITIPALESSGMLNAPLGRVVVGAAVIEDVASLILLSFFLQYLQPTAALPLSLLYIMLLLLFLFIRWLMPKIHFLTVSKSKISKTVFQQDLRIVFVVLLGIVLLFEAVGLHPIVAGFFAGFLLSESIRSDTLKHKFYAISYGIFIPIFFILVGARAELNMFYEAGHVLIATAVIVTALIASKFFSGFLGARLAGFSSRESAFVGSATIPQLSTSLAASFAGHRLGVIPDELMTSIIILTIITTLLAPIGMRLFLPKKEEQKEVAPAAS